LVKYARLADRKKPHMIDIRNRIAAAREGLGLFAVAAE
jgi:hypothetical protein